MLHCLDPQTKASSSRVGTWKRRKTVVRERRRHFKIKAFRAALSYIQRWRPRLAGRSHGGGGSRFVRLWYEATVWHVQSGVKAIRSSRFLLDSTVKREATRRYRSRNRDGHVSADRQGAFLRGRIHTRARAHTSTKCSRQTTFGSSSVGPKP